MSKLTFNCGCTFPIIGGDTDINGDLYTGQLPTGIDVDIYNIPHDCPRTWALFAEGRTKGVFQLEGHLGKTWATKVQPDNMEELAALVALLRPGCLRAMSRPAVRFLRGITLEFADPTTGDLTGQQRVIIDNERYEIIKHQKVRNQDQTVLWFPEGTVVVDNDDIILYPSKSMTEHYKDRKQKLEDVEYFHKTLEPILGNTYGVLVYQEQSMKIAVTLAGFDLQQADILRKAIGKKKADIMSRVRGDFLGGCTEKAIVTQEQAEEIFGWIQESQRYSFNQSHAISYGEGGYWTAYLKAHFPVQFFCSYIHGAQWKQDTAEEVYELVNDAKLLDIEVKVPDFRHQQDIPYIRNNEVFFGLGDIKQIGSSALRKLKEQTQQTSETISKPVENWSWIDYLISFSGNVSKTTNEALISCGSLDFFGKHRTEMLYELQLCDKLTSKERKWIEDEHQQTKFPNFLTALRSCAHIKKDGGGCHNVNRVKIVGDMANILENPPHSLTDTADFMSWCEEKYLGTHITCSKVDSCQEAVNANATCKEVVKGRSGYTVLAVEITRIKEVKTKQGKQPGRKMAFVGLADSTCAIDDVVAFPDVWGSYSSLLTEGNTVLVQGEKGNKKGKSFVIKKVWQI